MLLTWSARAAWCAMDQARGERERDAERRREAQRGGADQAAGARGAAQRVGEVRLDEELGAVARLRAKPRGAARV
jgi:hypothetical protein